MKANGYLERLASQGIFRQLEKVNIDRSLTLLRASQVALHYIKKAFRQRVPITGSKDTTRSRTPDCLRAPAAIAAYGRRANEERFGNDCPPSFMPAWQDKAVHARQKRRYLAGRK